MYINYIFDLEMELLPDIILFISSFHALKGHPQILNLYIIIVIQHTCASLILFVEISNDRCQ